MISPHIFLIFPNKIIVFVVGELINSIIRLGATPESMVIFLKNT